MMPMGINYLGPGGVLAPSGNPPTQTLWPVRVGSGRAMAADPSYVASSGGVLLNMHTPRVCPSLQAKALEWRRAEERQSSAPTPAPVAFSKARPPEPHGDSPLPSRILANG